MVKHAIHRKLHILFSMSFFSNSVCTKGLSPRVITWADPEGRTRGLDPSEKSQK